MRVLVCGGRRYRDRDHIWNSLSELDKKEGPFDVIIHGAATGADTEAEWWAKGKGRKHAPFQAQWDDISQPDAIVRLRKDGSRYDALAGIRRNTRMIEEGRPDLCVAFPGGPGTADMVRKARAAGIRVIRVPAPGEICETP